MSQSSLQLLLHAGELEYIVDTIKTSRNKNAGFVGGCLFGLWRNSLIQPVIQFVTGPGKHFEGTTSVDKMFRSHYVKECAQIMMRSHCLLHLGFWFSGSPQQQDIAKNLTFKIGHNVLLVINFNHDANTRQQLNGEYFLRKDNEDYSQLFAEDILPGHSSFRKFKTLTDEINYQGALVSPIYKGRAVKEGTESLIKDLPSRVQVEEAVTSETQWYATEGGMKQLQLLFQYFQGAGITPEMSRDTATQDMQFGFSGGYSLDFPSNFPKEMPTFLAADGRTYRMNHNFSRDKDVCEAVVETVVKFLQDAQSSRRGGRGGKNY